MKKRILALLLTLFMLASLFPAAALAEAPAEGTQAPAEDAEVPEEIPEEAPAEEPEVQTCNVDIYIQPGLEAGTTPD